MKNDLNLNLKSLQPQLKKALKVMAKHAVFAAVIIVLLVYVFVVGRINQLANAEPAPDAETVALAKSTVPRIDKSAIQQIQTLEQTNTQTQSLFDQARSNPFQE